MIFRDIGIILDVCLNSNKFNGLRKEIHDNNKTRRDNYKIKI